MPPVIDKTLCSKCGLCSENCPLDILHTSAVDGYPEVRYPEECWHCNACKLDCPNGGIQMRFPLPAMLLYTNASRGR